MSNGATNVDHKIKVCMAQIEAGMKELKPISKVEIPIGKYLMEHPTAKLTAEQNRAIDIAKRDAAKKERDKKANKEEINKAVKNYKKGQDEQGSEVR